MDVSEAGMTIMRCVVCLLSGHLVVITPESALVLSITTSSITCRNGLS